MSLTALPWLIRDVFRQARAVGLTATLAACTGIAVLACLSVGFAPLSSEPDKGTLTTFFGLVTVIDGESLDTGTRFLLFVLAGVAADTLGVLLALIWTAGFLPTALEASAASVVLTKPVSRATLIVGKILGVLTYVGVQATAFIALTALALGLRTGVWLPGYWLCVPLLLAHFAAFYSISALIAVSTRNTAACVVGSLIAWMVCWGINYGRHALVGLEAHEVSAVLIQTVDIIYWLLPKPADFGLILYDALGADRFVTPWVEFRAVQSQGQFQPILSVLSSLACAVNHIGLTVYEFLHEDY